jgi:uncharacterized protein (DUF362 family)
MSSSPREPRKALVFVETGDDPAAALDRLLERTRLVERVIGAAELAGTGRAKFPIAIKPNLMVAAGESAGAGDRTDPALVERLAAVLAAEGFGDVAVVESAVRGLPPVADVARAAGYSGVGYRIVDLSAEAEPFGYGSVLGDHVAGRTWSGAGFRISFGKAKTQWQSLFAGALANLYGCLPEPDKLGRYHGAGHEFHECCVLVADRMPVHFGIVDAWVGGDGRGSHAHARRPRPTGTLLASDDLLALDWVVGEKMGVDPNLSLVLQEALLRWGRVEIVRRGNTTEWRPWENMRTGKVAAAYLLEPALRSPPARATLRALGTRGRRLAAWTVQ